MQREREREGNDGEKRYTAGTQADAPELHVAMHSPGQGQALAAVAADIGPVAKLG